MSRIIWLLAILLLTSVILDWYSDNQKLEKINEIKATNAEMHKHLDAISDILDQIREEMKDDTAWLKTVRSLKNSLIK